VDFEPGQVSLGDWPRWQERRWGVAARFGSSRHEDTVGYAGVEVHMVVERGAEAVQEGDAAEPRRGSIQRVGSRGDTRGRQQEPLDLGKVMMEPPWTTKPR